MASGKTQGRFVYPQIGLRVLAAALASVSIYMMVNSEQTVSIFGFTLSARYSYSVSFKYLLIVDGVVAVSSLLSLLLVCVLNRNGSNLKGSFLLFLHDLVMVVLVTSGCAAAASVGYVGKYGQEESGWSPICDRVPKFCHKMTISSVLAFSAFFCYLIIIILSAYNLMSTTRSRTTQYSL